MVALVAVAALPPTLRLEAVPVRYAPEPENPVADKIPVPGTNDSFELDTPVLEYPPATDDHTG